MAIELVTDPAEEGYNSFVSLDEAELYFDQTYFPEGNIWLDIEPDDQARLLITASRLLSALNWTGVVSYEGQVLAFPRDYSLDNEVTPTFVKQLTLEYARWLYTEGLTATDNSGIANISEVKIGELMVKFRASSTTQLPESILSILGPLSPYYITLGGAKARSMRMVY